MRRRLLALALLVLLTASAGCMGIFGPGEVDQQRLNEDASYDWNTSANATIDVRSGEYQSVYVVSNQSEIEFYERDGFGTERPLEISALKFQYENGTVVNASTLDVSQTRNRLIVGLPAADGKVAFTGAAQGKSFATPTFVTGTYEVILPPGMRVDYVPLAQVQPGGYETRLEDNRVHITWDDVQSRAIVLRWYLDRDLTIFATAAAGLAIAGVVGAFYYLRQIRVLRERREDLGLSVDMDDDRRRPPPGMR
ncbi:MULTISPECIES: DUF5803 family protein [unclassified Haladaptatus]|uniref:DUF5803 family protein n=1 Tax=unclassified Haladaptatus TaxID=2622732 RepID=UPI0023E7F997|nr:MULTISPECIES: DUF5803 family protein [unclassified Haladaptatus]